MFRNHQGIKVKHVHYIGIIRTSIYLKVIIKFSRFWGQKNVHGLGGLGYISTHADTKVIY